MLKAAEYLRSLSFGSLIGGGVAGLLFSKWPQLFPAGTDLEGALLAGSVIGTLTHRLIDTVVLKGLLHPLIRFVVYYRKLGELFLLRQVIDERTRKTLIDELTVEHFLERRLTAAAPVPPKSEESAPPPRTEDAAQELLKQRETMNKILKDTGEVDRMLQEIKKKVESSVE